MKTTKPDFIVLLLCLLVVAAGPAAAGSAIAPSEPSDESDGLGEPLPERRPDRRCSRIRDDDARLACYDAHIRQGLGRGTFIERHWDLADRGRLFQPWAHRPNFILPARYSTDVNTRPFRESAELAGLTPPDLQSIESKFQISFKTKLVENLMGGPGDLWFGYTQQSHFQVYNASESRPFRETDFEPEAMLTFPIHRTWGSWTWRMAGAGIVHQSNGRSEPLSRSWNRVYGIVGIEHRRVAIHARAWARIDSTSDDDDDNPGITDNIGRFEAVAHASVGRHVLGLRARSNLDFRGHRGSVQVDWFFPIGSYIRGQVQAFSGYGESLIDFDHRQNTIGFGVLLFDPF